MENQYYYPINMVRPEPVNNGPVVGGIERGFVHDVNDLKPGWFGRVLRKLSYILGILGIVVLITWVAPNVYYLVSGNSKAIEVFKRPLVGFGGLGRDKPVVSTEAERIFQPAVDPSLPNEDRLRIPYIGLDTQIHEASLDNYEDALKAGVWRVTDFGTPWSRNKPTILVAHRYGYLAWSNFFRKKSSFYNLPKLSAGEIVEVYWGQRKYVYEVYSTGEGEEIADYTADLILYTCESLNSPVRVFKYGRLLEV